MDTSKIQWVRKLDRKVVFKATANRLEDGRFFPCDEVGNLLSTGTVDAPEAVVEAVAPEPTSEEQANQEKADSMHLALIARAKELGIKAPHKMNEDTLVARIAQREEELENA